MAALGVRALQGAQRSGLWNRCAQIDVEVDFSKAKTTEESSNTVGLPDAAVSESRDRVRSAINNSGFDPRPTRITITLRPLTYKERSGSESAYHHRHPGRMASWRSKDVSDFVLVRELGLDGGLRAVQGMLPIADAARTGGSATR